LSLSKYNFYLDPESEEFITFPKRRAAGAALLMFDKAARPAGGQEKWANDPATGKKTVGRLATKYAHLQSKLNALLESRGMKPGPPAGLLVGAGNEVRPKVKIRVGSKVGNESDFISGSPRAGLTLGKQTAFPLFGGSRSFFTQTDTEARIGWEIDFAGKFTPAVSFFYQQGDDMFIFFPESPDLRRVADMTTVLNRITAERDENFYRNFNLLLGGYFGGRSEVTLGFLHRIFVELTWRRRAESKDDHIPDEELFEDTVATVQAEAVYDAVARDAPVNLAVVAARKKGNVWLGRDYFSFTESLYLARLLDRMTDQDDRRGGQARCDVKRLMHALIDFDSDKNKTLLRDQICDLVLRKQSVLQFLERHAYQRFSGWNPGDPLMIGPLLDFANIYEPELREVEMEKHLYVEMVNRAQWLGRNIAEGVVKAASGTERNESAGRSKGVFFRLRRVRTKDDFLNELSRLQMRYALDIPAKALDADCFNEESFPEYRGFCVIAALRRFQYLIKPKPQGGSNSKST
jgi:hypothetical protein